MSYPMALITWNDAQGGSGWTDEKSIEHKPDKIHSVGYVVRNDEVGITICQSYNDGDRIADTLFIPRNYVESVTTLAAVQ